MQSKTDLRVIKTKSNIKKVFIELLYQKEFSKITVQEILGRALINRSTFYKYYTDKYDLAEYLVDEVIKDSTIFINERFTSTRGGAFFPPLNVYMNIFMKEEM
jgi:AcrR family transcriptional regulator